MTPGQLFDELMAQPGIDSVYMAKHTPVEQDYKPSLTVRISNGKGAHVSQVFKQEEFEKLGEAPEGGRQDGYLSVTLLAQQLAAELEKQGGGPEPHERLQNPLVLQGQPAGQ